MIPAQRDCDKGDREDSLGTPGCMVPLMQRLCGVVCMQSVGAAVRGATISGLYVSLPSFGHWSLLWCKVTAPIRPWEKGAGHRVEF